MKYTKEEIISSLQKHPSEENLALLPLFAGRKYSFLTIDMLHKSFYPDVSVSNILFNSRANSILDIANIRTIGELMLTSYTDLLLCRNCGLQTIEVFQAEIRNFLLYKRFDYSPYWTDLESMFFNVLNVKERNLLIFLDRMGVNQKKPYTLQKCGDKFNITREAVRQIVNQIGRIILHPETEFKLRPFWQAIDKNLKTKEIMVSEELARKVRNALVWEKKPEPHALEQIMKIKGDKYAATHNGIVGLVTSKCFECDKFDGLLDTIMGNKEELSYQEVFEQFFIEFEKICPEANTLQKNLINSLIELRIHEQIKQNKDYTRKPTSILNRDFDY